MRRCKRLPTWCAVTTVGANTSASLLISQHTPLVSVIDVMSDIRLKRQVKHSLLLCCTVSISTGWWYPMPPPFVCTGRCLGGKQHIWFPLALLRLYGGQGLWHHGMGFLQGGSGDRSVFWHCTNLGFSQQQCFPSWTWLWSCAIMVENISTSVRREQWRTRVTLSLGFRFLFCFQSTFFKQMQSNAHQVMYRIHTGAGRQRQAGGRNELVEMINRKFPVYKTWASCSPILCSKGQQDQEECGLNTCLLSSICREAELEDFLNHLFNKSGGAHGAGTGGDNANCYQDFNSTSTKSSQPHCSGTSAQGAQPGQKKSRRRRRRH